MNLNRSLLIGLLATWNLGWAASGYQYECKSIDDNAPYGLEKIQLKFVKVDKVELHLVDLKVKETYLKDESYNPSSPKLKSFDRFEIVDPNFAAYAEGPVTPFYVEKVLATGGKKLKIGKKGGFLKTAGHGYSWASYLCYR